MIEPIIALLIDLGILRADFKHYNKVKKKEREDGKKRTLSKYLLQPSSIAVLIVIVLMVLISPLIRSGLADRRLQTTTNEMNEIKETLEKWRSVYNSYPAELKEITRGRPLRKGWLTDEWKQPYVYELSENLKSFILISSGPDQILGSSDDLEVK